MYFISKLSCVGFHIFLDTLSGHFEDNLLGQSHD